MVGVVVGVLIDHKGGGKGQDKEVRIRIWFSWENPNRRQRQLSNQMHEQATTPIR